MSDEDWREYPFEDGDVVKLTNMESPKMTVASQHFEDEVECVVVQVLWFDGLRLRREFVPASSLVKVKE
jgi:hypothetical protein